MNMDIDEAWKDRKPAEIHDTCAARRFVTGSNRENLIPSDDNDRISDSVPKPVDRRVRPKNDIDVLRRHRCRQHRRREPQEEPVSIHLKSPPV